MLFTRKSKEVKQYIDDAYDNSNLEWRLEAETILWRICRKDKLVTSEEVLFHLERKGIKTHNNSAIGGVFLKAKNNGWIAPYGYVQSRRRSRHQAPIRVWKSLIVKGGKNAIQEKRDSRQRRGTV